MNDVAPDFRALPVFDPDRLVYHRNVCSFQRLIDIDTKRRARLWFCIAVCALTMTTALSIAVSILLPLKTLVPFYLVTHDDGTIDSGISLSDLGVDMAQKAIRASVWRYVEERESYSFSEAKHRYDLVSLMSDEDVQRDYQKAFLTSPDSPQKTIGKKGLISVREIGISPVRDGVFNVRFWRIKTLYGEKEERTSATATVEYEYLTQAPKDLILGGDFAAIRITRYQVEENTP